MTTVADYIDARWKATLERVVPVLERILSHDVPLPIYAARASQLPAEIRAYEPTPCLGWTADWAGSLLESWLRERGDWRGLGIGLFLVDDYPRYRWTAEKICGTVVHEIAHLLVTWVACADKHAPEVVFSLPVPPPPTPPDTPSNAPPENPWFEHHDRWIRLGLHLCHRAKQAGLPVELRHCAIAGKLFGLSYGERYLRALNSEPRAREGETLTQVALSRAPAAFRWLWQRDTNRPLPSAVRAAADDLPPCGPAVGRAARQPTTAPSRPGGDLPENITTVPTVERSEAR
ncbi:MAG: hypothetical protein ACYC35_28190 [Pirellulales bacterium]